MRKRILVGSVLVVAIVALFYLLKRASSSDEEAPIIVKNGGSMDVIAGDDVVHNKHWKWTDSGGAGNQSFFHDPTGPHSNKDPGPLFVYLIGSGAGTCTKLTTGDTVTVAYNDGFTLKFSRLQHGSSNNYYTHIDGNRPELTPVGGAKVPTLKHGDATGYIDSVTVGTANPCTFANAAALTRICVSPKDPTDDCEDWAEIK